MPVPAGNPEMPESRRLRFFFSFLIIGHLLAVVTAPLVVQSRGSIGAAPIVTTLMSPVQRYGEFVYVDRGYAFFAPDPGPNHLIQAAIGPAERRIEKRIPDLSTMWPRLKYHRHLMLADYFNQSYEFPLPPNLASEDAEAARQWQMRRSRYEELRKSIADHLSARHGGDPVLLARIRHNLPQFIAFQNQPIPLTDPRLYEVLPDRLPSLNIPPDQTLPAARVTTPAESVPPPSADREPSTDKQTRALFQFDLRVPAGSWTSPEAGNPERFRVLANNGYPNFQLEQNASAEGDGQAAGDGDAT
ncbi:MAG: hypothetical protein AAF958_04640 [Planctomycetota bacterium]